MNKNIALLVCLSFSLNYFFQPNENQSLVTEEYLIYSLLLANAKEPKGHPAKQLVIQSTTLTSPIAKYIPEDYLEAARIKLSPELNEAISDCKEKNTKVKSLVNSASNKKTWVLLPSDEFDKIFESGNGWKKFYKKYPHSAGISKFSQVGFNKEMTIALVYTEVQCDWECGGGAYFVFQKQAGTWKKMGTVDCWTS